VVILITIIRTISYILTLVVLADIIVGYFLNPYHQIRRVLDSIVQPMLAPIRRLMPKTGMLDFSPVVLIILIQLGEAVLIWFISNLM
jgi:YggT family protein